MILKKSYKTLLVGLFLISLSYSWCQDDSCKCPVVKLSYSQDGVHLLLPSSLAEGQDFLCQVTCIDSCMLSVITAQGPKLFDTLIGNRHYTNKATAKDSLISLQLHFPCGVSILSEYVINVIVTEYRPCGGVEVVDRAATLDAVSNQYLIKQHCSAVSTVKITPPNTSMGKEVTGRMFSVDGRINNKSKISIYHSALHLKMPTVENR